MLYPTRPASPSSAGQEAAAAPPPEEGIQANGATPSTSTSVGTTTPPTSEAAAFVEGARKVFDPQEIEARRVRVLGSMLAGATGDALGGSVEFKTIEKIIKIHGEEGIRDYAEAYGRRGAVTDDTQMSLFTAEALMRARHQGVSASGPSLGRSYQRWLKTQGGSSPVMDKHPDAYLGGLLMRPGSGLYEQRAPGRTCLNALRAMKEFSDVAKNDSKGCGGVMRVAPVGLFHASNNPGASLEQVFDEGGAAAAITHGHVTSTLSSGAFAALIFRLTEGKPLTEALAEVKALLRTKSGHEETLMALNKAEQYAADGLPPGQAIPRLGQGWIAEEALAIGVYAVLTTPNLEEAVIVAVNHSGDSDSTGSIAGNLAGAIHGVDAIPERWLTGLELRDTIAKIAEDLHKSASWDDPAVTTQEDRERIKKRYPE